MTTERINILGLEWVDLVNADEKEVNKIVKKYDFHELDREAVLEENQRARVDTYENYIFIVLHFPKYDPRAKRYLLNEFNIFFSKEYLISFRYYQSSTVERIIERYRLYKGEKDKVNTGYMLYDLIDAMLDKMFRLLDRQRKDLRALENDLFVRSDEELIQEIMIKKRNIITLKHMIEPQLQVLKILELRVNSLFKDEIEVYFENLEDKVEKIYAEIQLLQENIDSMQDTLKSIFDMQTNKTIKYLTLFSAFMLPLTLITSFFGMNVEDVPFTDLLVYSSIATTVIIMGIITFVLVKMRKM